MRDITKEKVLDIAFEIRAAQKRIAGLYNALKEEKEKSEELLKRFDKVIKEEIEITRNEE